MIDSIGYGSRRSSHDRVRDHKRYVPLIKAHLEEAGEVESTTEPGGKLKGVKVHLLVAQGKAVVKVSENTLWHIFQIPTDDPDKFLDEFRDWCRPAIQHAQILRG